ncbi:PA2169 family four-helix-bundle protein [Pseudopedobacter beijingensis]|uniref:PA2169 family four-helix-bundle protein n=1 Tax=Pseudopedobacter beijingensis TaxID=1207056 RepID=A0ABW4IGM1_9SPHI
MKTYPEDTRMVLTDLVQINNDRIKAYEKAIHELPDAGNGDLKAIFADMIKESHRFRNELLEELEVSRQNTDIGTTAAGTIYRAWMDIKNMFDDADRKSILDSCEHSEDAVQKAYKQALDEEHIPAFIKEIIKNQQHSLKLSHDQIRVLRNQQRG